MGEKTVPENLTIMSISNSATGFYCRTELTIHLKYGSIMEQLWKLPLLRIGRKKCELIGGLTKKEFRTDRYVR